MIDGRDKFFDRGDECGSRFQLSKRSLAQDNQPTLIVSATKWDVNEFNYLPTKLSVILSSRPGGAGLGRS
jgi:hypothetical protein